MLFIENKYYKIYMDLVLRGQARGKSKGFVKHHIIPECCFINRTRNPKNPGWLEGNPNNPSNITYLTHKEHLLCHILLVNITTGLAKTKMECAVYYMTRTPLYKSKLTLRLYDKFKRTSNSFTPEWKANISAAKRGKPTWNKGILRTEEEKGRARRQAVDPTAYKQPPCSPEKARKIKEANTGKKWVHDGKGTRLNVGPNEFEKLVNDGWIPGLGKRTVTLVKCGNCGKKTDKANYIKWHGDKCKLASNNFFKPILTSFPFQ